MCELLVRVVDKVNTDPYLDVQCTKRGNVIVIQPDNWWWGKEELKNPDYRIIRLPGIPASHLASLLAPELPDDPANPSRMLRRRGFRLDLGHPYFDEGAEHLADGKRKNGMMKLRWDLGKILGVRIQNLRLQDPNVFEPL